MVKTMANNIMDCTGAPAYLWLLCLMYVCFLLNNTFSVSLGCTSICELTQSTNDISPILRFHFNQPIHYKLDDSDFPSDTTEKWGCFVGIAKHVGHTMTFKILTNDTQEVIYHSNVCPATDSDSHNLHANLLNEDYDSSLFKPTIKSHHDSDESQPDSDNSRAHGETEAMPTFDFQDLIGHTFLKEPQEDGQHFHAQIV
jgi:hypothetical protein